MKKIKIRFVITGLIILLIVFLFLYVTFPILPKPTGKYSVGSTDFILEDIGRPDPYSDNMKDHRILLLKAWYPAGETKDFKQEYYFKYLEDMPEFPKFLIKYFGQIKTNSFSIAPIVKEKETFPIILFSHDRKSVINQNTVQTEELASHGYVVFAIGHTYDARITVFPDGKKIPMNKTKIEQFDNDPSMDKYTPLLNKLFGKKVENMPVQDIVQFIVQKTENANNESKFYESLFAEDIKGLPKNKQDQILKEKKETVSLIAEINHTMKENVFFKIRKDDLKFSLTEIIKMNSDSNSIFYGRLNIEKIGIFGNARGGAAVEKVCLEDNRFSALLSLDGPIEIFPNGQILNIPFMQISSEKRNLKTSPIDNVFEKAGFPSPDFFSSIKSREDLYYAEIKNSGRQNLTDLNLLPRYFKSLNKIFGFYDQLDLIGDIDPDQMRTIENDLLLSFFDKYLKGKNAHIEDKELLYQGLIEVQYKSKNDKNSDLY